MIRTYLFGLFVVCLSGLWGQTTVSGSFDFGGINRTYTYYVPATYIPGEAVPLVLNLHGFGTDGDYQAQYRDFRPIADTANFIVVHPDGSKILGQRFWNYGNVAGSTVDDVGFLEALIDTIAASYAIDPQRVYCTGMSNGSFMSYYLACQSDRFAAIGSVTGSMSVDMYNSCIPAYPTPVIHIHGTEDNVNPYEGTSTMKGVDPVTRFWVDRNACDTTPVVSAVPDLDPNDGATAEHLVYSGGIDGHTVELFRVIGGEHTWPGSPVPGSNDITCMDFDASIETWRFFSRYSRSETALVQHLEQSEPEIWPNPADGLVYIRMPEDRPITEIVIADMQGRVIQRYSGNTVDHIDVGGLDNGTYLLRISGSGFETVKKLEVGE